MNIRSHLVVIAGLLMLGAGCSQPSFSPGSPTNDADSATAPPSDSRLDLSGKNLKEVPSYVYSRTGLTELDVSDNRITGALQAEIRQLRQLQVLDASGNGMTGVPAEIGQLSNLRELDLSDNALTGLPLEMGNLSKLKRLDLSGNDISRQDLEAIRIRLDDAEIIE